MITISLSRLAMFGLLATLIWQALPQRLDVILGQAQTVYQTNAGSVAITITLTAKGNDNGIVAIEIMSNCQVVGTIQSHYNYDFFANQPAGWMRRTWIDDDWQRDLLLIPAESEETYFVSSKDGKLHLN